MQKLSRKFKTGASAIAVLVVDPFAVLAAGFWVFQRETPHIAENL